MKYILHFHTLLFRDKIRPSSTHSSYTCYMDVENQVFLPSIEDAEMERLITMSHSSSFDLDRALKLYDCLKALVAPQFTANRMELLCIAFQILWYPMQASG